MIAGVDEGKSERRSLRKETCAGLASPAPMADHPGGGAESGSERAVSRGGSRGRGGEEHKRSPAAGHGRPWR